MSDIAIFSFGSVLFILVTWATLAFGLSRMHELQVRDMAGENRYPIERPDGFTEIHVAQEDPGSRQDRDAEKG